LSGGIIFKGMGIGVGMVLIGWCLGERSSWVHELLLSNTSPM
jgi:hypothetical protein